LGFDRCGVRWERRGGGVGEVGSDAVDLGECVRCSGSLCGVCGEESVEECGCFRGQVAEFWRVESDVVLAARGRVFRVWLAWWWDGNVWNGRRDEGVGVGDIWVALLWRGRGGGCCLERQGPGEHCVEDDARGPDVCLVREVGCLDGGEDLWGAVVPGAAGLAGAAVGFGGVRVAGAGEAEVD
jgi:hypothetical protein